MELATLWFTAHAQSTEPHQPGLKHTGFIAPRFSCPGPDSLLAGLTPNCAPRTGFALVPRWTFCDQVLIPGSLFCLFLGPLPCFGSFQKKGAWEVNVAVLFLSLTFPHPGLMVPESMDFQVGRIFPCKVLPLSLNFRGCQSIATLAALTSGLAWPAFVTLEAPTISS